MPDCTIFDGAELYLDRFDQFNKQELEILAALLRRHVPMTIALTGDLHQPELFPETIHAVSRLKRLAGRTANRWTSNAWNKCSCRVRMT